MPSETGLRGKVVIVTGGAAGIGRATALRFAEEGARVAVWDLNEDGVASLLDQITAAGGEGMFAKVNVAHSEEVTGAVAQVIGQWGRIDVLINNAGIVRDAQLVKWKDGEVVSIMTDEVFDAVVDVNLKGVFYCARGVAPRTTSGPNSSTNSRRRISSISSHAPATPSRQ
jgi:3-oxoacyl-[acyl-carrier protein] reductase